MKKVILIGYMGSGKSVISAQLAQKMGFVFVELDDCIEKKSGTSIANLFQTKGELYFRKLEREIFLKLVNDPRQLIISTGGGTPCYYNNHKLLQVEGVVSVYLMASVTTLVSRLSKEKHARPLIANLDSNDLNEFIAKHLFDRSFYYNQATFKVSVDAKSENEITSEIVDLLV